MFNIFNKTRLRRKAMVLGGRAWGYAKTHKMEMLRLGILAAIVLMPENSCFAQDTQGGADEGFEAISGPLEKLNNFMTGKGAKIAATIGASAGIGAWTLNTDNQIVKNALRLTAGTGALLTVPAVVKGVSGFLIP